MRDPHLVILDMSGIQDYILSAGSGKLKLIRGGSYLLNRVNCENWPGLAGGSNVISATGGNLVAVLPGREEADDFLRRAQRVLAETTGGVRAVGASVAYPDKTRFAESRRALLEALARRKAAGGPPQWLGGNPFGEQCSVCGSVPAVAVIGDDLYCRRCELRHLASVEARADLPAPGRRPESFQDIGAAAKPEDYLAFVYIDFDGMGKYFDAAATTEDNFRDASQRVDDTVKAALRHALQNISPYEILLVGGDDVALMLPAQDWLRFLTAFAREFEARFGKTPTPTFSAGVVFAHSHFPIGEFFRIGKSLQQSAKKIRGQNSLDWEIVTSAMLDDPVQYRRLMAKDGRMRTAKPYSLRDLELLAARLRDLRKEGPSTKVNALYRAAYAGIVQAELDYLWLLTRLSPAANATVRAAVGKTFWQTTESGTVVTRAADFAELWAFV